MYICIAQTKMQECEGDDVFQGKLVETTRVTNDDGNPSSSPDATSRVYTIGNTCHTTGTV